MNAWKNLLKTAFFSSSGLECLAARPTLARALLFLLASAAVLAFPTDFSGQSVRQALFSAVIVFFGLAAAATASFAASRVLGSRTAFKNFFAPV
ncbi:MAG: hypothetical protein AB1626_05520, partial [Candidatus Micrarchaeota archaeon]